ncbi:MAG: sodium ion-translocating decarboxylase subunit beta [Sulfuricurvum sp.]|jgi:oxaloacetate decarboxylase beta subunit|uniref:sodium ion-translocating decarboxylase subunit beta n=1 Tax=Sulfuricurvum sp. TaxID=2025608 RepID=UPI0025D69141|nr:sodium ion-translocating decarboxylase subunit beta [Sulfuricurvum sp.]MCK9373809.1 sodium ion-translocating decarboxylase subunit beta [Sulfuricurvum sp.]
MKKLLFFLLTVLCISFSAMASEPISVTVDTDIQEITANLPASDTPQKSTYREETYQPMSFNDMMLNFYHTTGISALVEPQKGVLTSHGEPMSDFHQTWGRLIMFGVAFILFYLAIAKGFEPLLLLPIAFGGLLANVPIANMAGADGFLGIIYHMGIANGLFPLLIFMGVGAMTDFGPLLANPRLALLGGAAQFGIFGTLVGAYALSQYTTIFDFTLQQSAAISIIGGADGPTSIFIASTLAPELLGAIAVASYSYMALVPIIQPPIMRALTTPEERKIRMRTLRHVTKLEKLLFPILVLMLIIFILPDAAPLVGAFTLGNFFKESGVVDRLSDTMQHALINIVTIFLGLAVGSKLAADQFLVVDTLAILALGLLAFSAGTAAGVLMAKLMNLFSDDKINPLIGSAGVSAVPMAARVSQKEGMKEDPTNMLLMHAMGPNVAGVIGSAVAAGVMIALFK